MRILYVEDDSVDIDLLQRHFKKAAPDIAVDVARTQREALTILRGPDFNQYDLVLTDMRLQDGDGIAILSFIRGKSLPLAVVVLTGQGDEEIAVSVLKSGADDYLSKRKGYLERLPKLLEHAVRSYKSSSHKRAKNIRVLYLEHNTADIDLTRRHFVHYASHIDIEAIATADQFRDYISSRNKCKKIDVFLLDYRLPGVDAIELYKEMFLDGNCDVPTILISGKGDEEIATIALKLGFFDYLSKNAGYLFKLPSVIENAYFKSQFQREHEALVKSEAKYRLMMESIIDPMYICSPGLIIEYINPAMVKRLGRDATGEFCYSALHCLDVKCDWCVFKELEIGEVIEKDITSPLDNRDYHVTSMPIENEKGTISKMTFYRDVTEYIHAVREKEKAQAQLIQAHKMEAIGNLAGGIAHDFNNILGVILGYADMAREDAPVDSKFGKDVEKIILAGNRAKNLVKQILAFSRQVDVERIPLQLQTLIKESVKMLRASIPANIEIIEAIDSKCGSVLADPTQVHQILMNLCTNANHAMEQSGGFLKVELRRTDIGKEPSQVEASIRPGQYAELIVSDNGPGIGTDLIDRIFEPYFTTKEIGKGTGMGLAIIHGIISDYGGNITVDSEPGKGTTFHVYFPTVEHSEQTSVYEDEDIPTGEGRILFIDDEELLAEIGKDMLERLGYVVTVRRNSIDALTTFQNSPDAFDAVITDQTMPGLSGADLSIRILQIRPDIPIILCTGYSNLIDEFSAKSIGIREFALKPLTKGTIAKLLKKVLGTDSADV